MASGRAVKRLMRNIIRGWSAPTRRRTSPGLPDVAREIGGATGNLFSNGWQQLEDGHAAYLRSFEPRVPPSLHVSHRDATRANRPVPLSERCLDDRPD